MASALHTVFTLLCSTRYYAIFLQFDGSNCVQQSYAGLATAPVAYRAFIRQQ
jgi:hypothetical protein